MPVHFLHDRKKFMRILRRILIIALAVYAVLSASHGIYRGFGDLNYNLFIYRVDDNFRKYKKEFESLLLRQTDYTKTTHKVVNV